MEKFNFYLDHKVTAWFRTDFEVEAETLEDAKKQALRDLKDGKIADLPWNILDETVNSMTVEDNHRLPTEELYHESGQMIWDNTDLSVEYDSLEDLSYEELPSNNEVALYVKDVWTNMYFMVNGDAEEDGRLFIEVNNEAVYLDTITRREE